MRRNWRAAVAVLAVLGVAAVVIPANVGAQKVLNPGAFALSATGGAIQIGDGTLLPPLSLTPQPLAQCEDGLDNDGDGKIDGADGGCVAGPQGQVDDSELAPGYQPKVDVSITGTVDAAGNITIPTSNIIFPVAYIGLPGYATDQTLITVTVVPTAAGTGTINPLTGDAVLDVKFRVQLTGKINGSPLSQCTIGSASRPISLNLITGRKEPIGTNGPLTGAKYNPDTGKAVMVDNAFAVPGASGCLASGWLAVSDLINQATGLGSGTAAGKNTAVLAGQTDPVLNRAIQPKITMTPGVAGPAPFFATFSASQTVVAKGPATYAWSFSEGTNLSGATVTRTFATPGPDWAVLTVTDGDGDSASTRIDFVTGASDTTTTSSTTTTTQPTTTTTSSTTTTTQPTTTTTSTTTTTQPTTTTTSTTTTTQPTTTTTQPPAGSDSASVSITGAVNYAASGTGAGGVTVQRDAFGISSVSGTLDVPGPNGGTAKVRVSVQRAWILPLWTGQVSVVDSDAGVSVTAPVFGTVSTGGVTGQAKGSTSWFLPGTFPNLIRPFTLNWTVKDAD